MIVPCARCSTLDTPGFWFYFETAVCAVIRPSRFNQRCSGGSSLTGFSDHAEASEHLFSSLRTKPGNCIRSKLDG
jgi:hypothetical protein